MILAKTKKGLINGIQKDGYHLFLGIPYAKPPVGALRWRPPQEMDSWEGTYSATQFPNRSMQEMGVRPGFYAKEFDHGDELMTPVS